VLAVAFGDLLNVNHTGGSMTRCCGMDSGMTAAGVFSPLLFK
jgi:hypothetical protein